MRAAMKSIWRSGTWLLLAPLIVSCAAPAVRTPSATAVGEEARRFMAGYAADLLRHDRDAIAARYSRRGTYVVFPGDWKLEPYDSIAARMYPEGWQGPAEFEWQDLSYEVLDEDAVAVVGGLRFEAEETSGFLGTYTALLVREDGELRIRLENESWDNLPPPECRPQIEPCDLTLEGAALERYTGEYDVAGEEASARIYSKDGSLMIQAPGLPPMRLLYRGGDEFRLAEFPPVRLVLHGAGKDAESYILFRGLVLGTGARVTAKNAADGPELAVNQTALKDTILSLTHQLAESWTRLDPDDYLGRFSRDLVFYFEGVAVPWPEFEAVVRQTMASLRSSTFEVLDPEVEVLGVNAAVVSFRLREKMVDRSGAVTDLRAALTLVFERRGDGWTIIRAHESLPAAGLNE